MFTPLAMKIVSGAAGLSLIACGVMYIGWNNAAHARDKAEARAEQAEEALVLAGTEIAALRLNLEEAKRDASILDNQETELENANTSDDPNLARLRNLCVRMRQQGRDLSDHPTCGRFAGDVRANSS